MKYKSVKDSIFKLNHEPKTIKKIIDTVPNKYLREFIRESLYKSVDQDTIKVRSLYTVLNRYLNYTGNRDELVFLFDLRRDITKEKVNWKKWEWKLRFMLLKTSPLEYILKKHWK